ncbi:MAG TPA: HypC/HybG/HupF family hydrogenase formation chaperone [Candidatus Moranbacteria bacterium]|nr:HypC/HybG/HupF family hydrogenase formation chaperone [Candidatus Moranbacteria bacterium]
MCLAYPGKIEKIEGDQAVADFDGMKKTVNISLVSDAEVGDHVIVHAGFAVQKLTKEDAWAVLETYEAGRKFKK